MSWQVAPLLYDLDHARGYMRGAVFFDRNDPFYVVDVRKGDGAYVASGWYLREEQKDALTKLEIGTEFTVKPYNLGYVNIANQVVRVSRVPARTFRYGLSTQSIHVEGPARLSREQMLTSPELHNTLTGKFPSILLNNNAAFHNKYAIKDDKIYYYLWNDPVGTMRNTEIEVERPFAFLIEELTDITGLVVV